jgi:hypothetical protein
MTFVLNLHSSSYGQHLLHLCWQLCVVISSPSYVRAIRIVEKRCLIIGDVVGIAGAYSSEDRASNTQSVREVRLLRESWQLTLLRILL